MKRCEKVPTNNLKDFGHRLSNLVQSRATENFTIGLGILLFSQTLYRSCLLKKRINSAIVEDKHTILFPFISSVNSLCFQILGNSNWTESCRGTIRAI